MTTNSDDVTTEQMFEKALEALFRTAHENDVPVRGGWELRNGDGTPDWDVVVTVVEKPPPATDDED
ncbi:hypothetical protein [Halorussus amylolyticus]|uniref:hypothetical protein n=1 Tax=Halorussus amylolyticus TaxID=1126242 RepID=UPI00138F710B|nr:hypothetical protein [Halorussus amylolyticus]